MTARRIFRFDLAPGDRIAGKYEVLHRLGAGWEGETYLLRERRTGVEVAGKLFFPQRNRGDRAARRYARKLHKLRQVSQLILYHTQEQIEVAGYPVTLLVSEYVDGEPLPVFLDRQPGKRLQPFQAVHLLHALAGAVEALHRRREYHGDLHDENVIVGRSALHFDLKLLDLYDRGPYTLELAQDDVLGIVRIFYDSLGGARRYSGQPDAVKAICRGLKSGLILQRFKSAARLRRYLEELEW